MKKFMVYLEDRNNVYKVAVPAKNKKAAIEYVHGNGDVIMVKDVTDEYPISVSKVGDALRHAGFGGVEIDLIMRCLTSCNIAE